MSDLTTYLLDWKAITDELSAEAVGVVARHTQIDPRLQAFADAWNREDKSKTMVRPELMDLFDALTEDNTCDECDGTKQGANHGTCWQCKGTGQQPTEDTDE